MIRQVLFGTVALLAGSAFVAAAGNDDVVAAAKKLKDTNNYSWKTTTENAGGGGGGGGGGQFRPGPTEGKTDKGTTMLTVTRGDNTIEVVIQGEKGAIKTQDGWMSFEEASQDQQGPGRFMGRMFRNFKAPADQVLEAAEKAQEGTKEGDVYTAKLSEEAAKSMLMFGGRRGGGQGGQGNGPEISNAKGTVKLWVQDGMLSKYQLHVTGTVSFNGNDRDIDRTTTTEIKDVGSTKVEIPDEAKKKLS